MKFGVTAVFMAALLAVASADDGGSSSGIRRAGRSTGVRSTAAQVHLLGIYLFDPGVSVIRKFGEPNEIQAIGGGSTSVAGAPGGGPAGGGPGGGGPGGVGGRRPGAPGGGGGGPAGASFDQSGPFGFGSGLLDEYSLNFQAPRGGRQGGPGGPPTPGPGGPQGQGGQDGGDFGRGGAGGGGFSSPGNTDRILYTRWVYRVGPSRYGFILNKQNQVVQIEAIGSGDSRVYTNRGIRFGSTFGDIIKRYGAPDAYEINGNSLVVRYLVRQRVAFRLNQLDPKKPYVVTGVVVAAGKA